MKRLSRYVGKAVLLATLATLLIVVALDAVGAIIGETGELRRNYHLIDALLYVAMTLPSRTYEYLPFAALIGALAGVGILAEKSEVIVMRAAGVSIMRIVVFVMRPILMVAVVGMLIGEFWAPKLDQYAEARRAYLLRGQSAQDSEGGLWTREANEFVHFNAVFPNGVVYGVSRYRFGDANQILESSFATRATYNRMEDNWVEENVAISRFLPERVETEQLLTRRWQTELTPDVLSLNVLAEDSMSIRNLWYYIGYLTQHGNETAKYWLALWNRSLLPLTVIGLVLLGISFVFGPLRQSTMGARIFLGVAIGVIFRIGQDLLSSSSIVFGIPAVTVVLAPVLFCAVVGFYLLKRAG